MEFQITFDPLLPWGAIFVLATVGLCVAGIGFLLGLKAWALRTLAIGVAVFALAGPTLQRQNLIPEANQIIVVRDNSASQSLGDRFSGTSDFFQALATQLQALDNPDIHVVDVGDGKDNAGTLVMDALRTALADIVPNRLAGIFVLTDGQIHDADFDLAVDVPLHFMISGQRDEWDRHLSITNAPAYSLIGDRAELTLLIDDKGAAPSAETVIVQLARDGSAPQTYRVPVGRPMTVQVDVPHGGANVLHFSTPLQEGELTDRNNGAIVQINGLRDRLRVLLVSGEPHPGERTWRNLLKSDPSVDLVHFTILRPPEKFDGVPVSELALIAFPTRELFMEKIDEFDLIIFDRYNRYGILPGLYFENIARYVEDGGAVLVSAGPGFATVDSLAHSPFGRVIPAIPTAQVFKRGYTPEISDLGQRHPITKGLIEDGGEPTWGRWFRQVGLEVLGGDILMTGLDGDPLLVVDRVGEGRIALLASDHVWLWDRGFEGGGPQAELLRRLSHWMMKEPDLEEEALTATATDGVIAVTRQSLQENPQSETIINAPDGSRQTIELIPSTTGQISAEFSANQDGLYIIENGDLRTVVALGPAAPKEFENPIASVSIVAPIARARSGGTFWMEDGLPRLREVRLGRPAAGRGWVGIVDRDAVRIADVDQRPLLPAWAWLLLISLLILAGWLIEGRAKHSTN